MIGYTLQVPLHLFRGLHFRHTYSIAQYPYKLEFVRIKDIVQLNFHAAQSANTIADRRMGLKEFMEPKH